MTFAIDHIPTCLYTFPLALSVAEVAGARNFSRFTRPLLLLCLVVHAAVLATVFHREGPAAILSLVRLVSLFAFFAVIDLQIVVWISGLTTLAAFLLPAPLFLLHLSHAIAPARATLTPETMERLLSSGWFFVHVPATLLGFAAFSTGFGIALIYLALEGMLRRRRVARIFQSLPPLETLDLLMSRTLSVGLPLLGLAVVSGMIWSLQTRGVLMKGDARELVTLACFAVYATVFTIQKRSAWRGRRAAILTLVGFGLVAAAFVAVGSTFHLF